MASAASALSIIGGPMMMRGAGLLPAVSRAAVIPAVPGVSAHQYHAQDELGQASYGYSYPGAAASNVRDAAGNMAGSYSYIDSTGKLNQVNYVADAMGFRVVANNLPVAPATPILPGMYY